MKNKFRVGDLVYTKNVGFPFNRTDYGHESWEGASCIVTEPVVNENYVGVEAIFPVKTPTGDMKTCIFRPEQLVKEDRPWLKKNLINICNSKKALIDAADTVKSILKDI